MRISFVGGGTDLPDFYTRHTGRVISSSIDKYVYLAVNRTPLINKVSARYSISESVDHPKDLQHTRIKAALLDMGITSNIEFASFASLPAKTGLGSSSAFSVALVKALSAYSGKSMGAKDAAEAASRLEIELVGEPIGKQDQYAAAFGGMNVIQFNQNHSVDVSPVLVDFKRKMELEDHLMLFFTGITRNASNVLSEQKSNIDKKMDILREMAESVHEFKSRLVSGDFKGLGEMLLSAWQKKKSLASGVSNSAIDDFYAAGMESGAWGGKVLGAGGGGCLLFMVAPELKPGLRKTMEEVAAKHNFSEFKEIPFKFAQSGAEIVYNGDLFNKTAF